MTEGEDHGYLGNREAREREAQEHGYLWVIRWDTRNGTATQYRMPLDPEVPDFVGDPMFQVTIQSWAGHVPVHSEDAGGEQDV